ncbi:MAG: hypothetical protein ABH830_03590 [Patescibacteria group bacterium]
MEKVTNSEENEKKINLNEYKDPGGLSIKKLDFGLWVLEHKKLFKQGIYAFIILVAVVSWTYTIYGFAYYLAVGMRDDESLIKELVQTNTINHTYLASQAAKNLNYSRINILPATNEKFDLALEIENPNEKHWAQFSYCLYSQEEEVVCGENSIFPSERKYILALGLDNKLKSSDFQFVINNIIWSRINLHFYPDWNKYYNEHYDILIKDIDFSPYSLSGLSEKINLNSLNFLIKNNSPYNYWEITFNILLYSGNTLAGVNQYTVSESISGEERLVEMSWPGSLNNINRIEIVPEINILDEDIYIKFFGGTGEEK